MRNIKFILSYDGRNYHGYQIQPNAVTVQGVIEAALESLLGIHTDIIGCSRTDTGVHARMYCFNAHIDNTIPCDGLQRAMNALLPKDIAIISCEDVDESFHARYDSKGKEYQYLLYHGAVRDVFSNGLALHYPYKIDAAALNEVAQLFVGEHDFAAFCRAEAKSHLKTTVRSVTAFSVVGNDEETRFTVSGTGFLHNMVRIMVGTLIYVSEGKRTLEDVQNALIIGERSLAGITAPPDGLYLNRVYY